MNTNRIRILVVATLGLLVAGAFASPAAGQDLPTIQGTFTLTSEVHWQSAVLPAGEYSFTLHSAAAPALILLKGPNGAQYLMPSGSDEVRTNERSSLTIERRGGSGYVSEMYLAPLGVRFSYGVPKAPKDQIIARGPATSEHVLISAAGK